MLCISKFNFVKPECFGTVYSLEKICIFYQALGITIRKKTLFQWANLWLLDAV